jgi:hypothetical protein
MVFGVEDYIPFSFKLFTKTVETDAWVPPSPAPLNNNQVIYSSDNRVSL